MSIADAQLTATIVSIIQTDPALRKVNFQFGKFTIAAMGYFSVAGLIQLGRIHCKVDASQIPSGAAAIYDITAHTIFAKDSRFHYDDEKVSVVHEATHAYLDMLGAVKKDFKVRNLDNETCAYLAGAIYARGLTQQASQPGVKIISSSQSINDTALNAVKAKPAATGPANSASMIVFSDQDVATLRGEIKKSPLYKDWNTVVTLTGM